MPEEAIVVEIALEASVTVETSIIERAEVDARLASRGDDGVTNAIVSCARSNKAIVVLRKAFILRSGVVVM